MRRVTFFAAGFLGVGFAWVSYVLLFVEPGMGFERPADFFDPQKVATGFAAPVWLVSNFIYLTFPAAILAIAYTSRDRLLDWFGLGSALLWLVVAAFDRVALQLPALLPTDDAVVSALEGALPVRFAILKSAVVALGLFAWRTTRAETGDRVGARMWRGFGWLVLAVCVAFMFAFVPVPLVLAAWGAALAMHIHRAPEGSALFAEATNT